MRALTQQRADLIDAAANDDESPVVEVMLFGRVDTERRVRLKARSGLDLGRLRRGQRCFRWRARSGDHRKNQVGGKNPEHFQYPMGSDP